jgi:N-ethylmaleimide reductase
MSKTILQPIKLGSLSLKNRVFMAPLTRSRATMPGYVPNELMATMYAQRATAGLLIAEATMITQSSAFLTEPGVYSRAQVEGWKKTTAAVHAKGGQICLQIVHGGRAAHVDLNNGAVPVAPSALPIPMPINAAFHPTGKEVPNSTPRALEESEIPGIIKLFVDAAANGIEAGFDAIEVHSANGYLLSQFLSPLSNQRTTGNYAGTSKESRARLTLEVLDAVSAKIGAQRVGIRISPVNQYNGVSNKTTWPDAPVETDYLAAQIAKRGVAYLHLMRADFFSKFEAADLVQISRDAINKANAANTAKTSLVANMGYTPETAENEVASGRADAIAFGVPFLANPDLVARIATGAKLNAPNPATFYPKPGAKTGHEIGYTDYPFLA